MQESSAIRYKLIFLINAILLMVLIFIPPRADAQWPPFRLRVNPSYQEGKIFYEINFRSLVDWQMADVAINIPLPAGTRFLEAGFPPATEVRFDGLEVSLFTALPDRGRVQGTVVLEVLDQEISEFSTYAWVSWKGDHPGDYLVEDISIDITRKPLAWSRPPRVRLQLEMNAEVRGDLVTYNIYVENTRGNKGFRMWDLQVNVPLPEEAIFISAEAPPPFVAGFDGREVSFSIAELAADETVPPLQFTVSAEGATAPLVTHAWATWKNSSRRAITKLPAVEETVTGDVIVQPRLSHHVVSDAIGDASFGNYDLTSIDLQDKGDHFDLVFRTTGPLCPAEAPVDYTLWINSDCQNETGADIRGQGAEYEIRYFNDRRRTRIRVWDAEAEKWNRLREDVAVAAPVGAKMVTMSIPYELIGDVRRFCWLGRTRNRLQEFTSNLPADWAPDNDILRVTRYEAPAAGGQAPARDQSKAEPVIFSGDPEACAAPTPAVLTAPAFEEIDGKLAVPVDNGQALYDVHIFSLPDGQEVARLANARQPHFRADGQRLLANREGGPLESIAEYDLNDGTQRPVSSAPDDSHPFYDPWGNRVVYDNPELTVGYPELLVGNERQEAIEEEESDADFDEAEGKKVYRDARKSFIFVQCGLTPPHLETEPRCREIHSLGKLVPASQMGEIVGSEPVWTAEDKIAYRGCNTWAGSRLCGIYTVPAGSTRGFSDGVIPRQLTDDMTDAPSDTKGDWLAFTSHRDGDWEAYIMRKDGTGLRNLSNSPQSNDGLPTISPDLAWAAFVSDRAGQWAIWVVPLSGGEPQQLFVLPNPTPWGDGDRVWTNERISWGP